MLRIYTLIFLQAKSAGGEFSLLYEYHKHMVLVACVVKAGALKKRIIEEIFFLSYLSDIWLDKAKKKS